MFGRCNLASDSSFVRPTLSQLIKRVLSDIATRLTGADANLRGSPEQVLGIAAAGLTHGNHGHLKWLSRQVLADLCEDEFLLRQASIFGLAPIPAVAATGLLTITGVNAMVCPAGTLWTRSDGAQFTQQADATIVGGQAIPTIVAVLAGVAGNCIDGTPLTIASPVAGINAQATVSGGGLTDPEGADIEDTEALRARLLFRLGTPPKGGGPGDYEAWALQVSGVTRAFEYPLLYGPGTVGLTFVRDGDVSIIPTDNEVAIVQAWVDGLRPVTADLTVFAPVADTQNFTIHIVPDTTLTRAAVTAEVQGLMARATPGGTTRLSAINEAIAIATGITDHTLISPVADVVSAAGHLALFGVITWA